MGSTKIFVIQLRELLKRAVYVIIGIVLLVLLAYFFIPKTKNAANSAMFGDSGDIYTPGTYAIELLLNNAPVNLEVEVTENEILSVKFTEFDEQQQVFYPLFDPVMKHLSSEVLRTQSSDVAMNSDYEITNRVLLDAIRVALTSAQS
jgi:uncharacterized protein with FMN-binding domain